MVISGESSLAVSKRMHYSLLLSAEFHVCFSSVFFSFCFMHRLTFNQCYFGILSFPNDTWTLDIFWLPHCVFICLISDAYSGNIWLAGVRFTFSCLHTPAINATWIPDWNLTSVKQNRVMYFTSSVCLQFSFAMFRNSQRKLLINCR